MAYQNVGTPRFYIDQIQHLKSEGLDFESQYLKQNFPEENLLGDGDNIRTLMQDSDLFTFNPENQKELLHPTNQEDGLDAHLVWDIPVASAFEIGDSSNMGRYVAILNHNLGDLDYKIIFQYVNWEWESMISAFGRSVVSADEVSILNMESGQLIENNGVTIFELNKSPSGSNVYDPPVGYDFISINLDDQTSNNNPVNIGALSFGVYFDMPYSPDLDLTMSVEFDGYDSVQTLGGSTLTNVRYSGSPWWYGVDGNKIEPWAVGESTGVSKRRGRRLWNLKFSYVSDKDLFASNYMSNTYTENADGYDSGDIHQVEGNDTFYYTLDNDDSFVAQVLNKVGNGQRFIFQPDNNNNNPDQFAICVLEQDSLDIKQVANSVYNISLKIKEVW